MMMQLVGSCVGCRPFFSRDLFCLSRSLRKRDHLGDLGAGVLSPGKLIGAKGGRFTAEHSVTNR